MLLSDFDPKLAESGHRFILLSRLRYVYAIGKLAYSPPSSSFVMRIQRKCLISMYPYSENTRSEENSETTVRVESLSLFASNYFHRK